MAVATWFVIDAIRTLGPLLSDLFDIGVTVAAGVGFATFAAGGALAALVVLLGRRWGHGTVLVGLALVIVALRFAITGLSEDLLIVVGVVLAVGALAFLLTSARIAVAATGGAGLAAGTAFGASMAVLEQTVLRTWDAVWRDDALGWIAIVVLAIAVVGSAWACRSVAADVPTRGWWAYGLFFSIVFYALGNIAFANSQTGLRMSIASVALVGGLLAGAHLAGHARRLPALFTTVLSALAIPAIVIVLTMPGAAAAYALPIAAATLTVAVSRAVRVNDGQSQAHLSVRRYTGAAVAFGLLALLPFMLVQLDYDVPLGIPHITPVALAGVAIALAAVLAMRKPVRTESTDAPVQVVTIGLVGLAGFAVLSALWTYTEYEEPRAYTMEFIEAPTVMVYNLHYGVTPGLSGGPSIDLDELVGVVKEANPDVLLLQEVDRGWVLAGGVDLLEYFAGELDMEFTYSPAHDPQFGNAVFTSRPFANARTVVLPYGDGPQRRSAAVVDFMGVAYASVHLQHKERDATRVAQVEALLDALGDTGPLVVGGDFNDTADSRTFATMIAAGFLSAHGEGKGQDTYVGPDFQAQIDYIFGRGVVLRDYTVIDSPWSDHLPMLVNVTLE